MSERERKKTKVKLEQFGDEVEFNSIRRNTTDEENQRSLWMKDERREKVIKNEKKMCLFRTQDWYKDQMSSVEMCVTEKEQKIDKNYEIELSHLNLKLKSQIIALRQTTTTPTDDETNGQIQTIRKTRLFGESKCGKR